MNIRILYKLSISFFCLIIVSCTQNKIDINKELAVLKKTGDTIQFDFTRIVKANKELADYCQKLYGSKKNIANSDDKKLLLNDYGIYYKPENDSGSAIYICGYFLLTKN